MVDKWQRSLIPDQEYFCAKALDQAAFPEPAPTLFLWKKEDSHLHTSMHAWLRFHGHGAVKLEQDEENILRRGFRCKNKKIQKKIKIHFKDWVSMTKMICGCENKRPLANAAPSAEIHPKMCRLLFLWKGAHSPQPMLGQRALWDLGDYRRGKGGAAGSSFQRLSQGTEATV